MNTKEYGRLVARRSHRSPVLKNTVCAFLVGGAICLFGEAIRRAALLFGATEEAAPMIATILLILLSAVLTGVGVYDTIARVAGAGTLVPVTGFANAVVSPALDSGSEGRVLGIGAKIFTVAGPVLLYAVLSGAAYGLILWLSEVLL